jgi:hypothetical protein
VYGKSRSVIVSTHCINKAFSYANGSSVNDETFLTGLNLSLYFVGCEDNRKKFPVGDYFVTVY